MLVIRPADANETAAAWRIALTERARPTLLALSRQKLPVLGSASYPGVAEGVTRGAYVLAEADHDGSPDAVIVATGSEVQLALGARSQLASEGFHVRVVSAPCLELFAEQPDSYRDSVVPPGVPLVSVEAGITLGWRTYLGCGAAAVGLDRFGASAPADTAMRELGFTVEHVVERVRVAVDDSGPVMW